jgi:hypothetical protein
VGTSPDSEFTPTYTAQHDEADLRAEAERLAPGAFTHLAADDGPLAELFEEMRAIMLDPDRLKILERGWPLALGLLRSEFDYKTAGERGLGRLSTSPPRLGGRFREALRPQPARQALGMQAERLIVAGFLGFGASSVNWQGGPPAASQRPLDVWWWAWVPGIYAELRSAGPTTLSVCSGLADEPLQALVRAAAEHGLVKGWRRRSSERVLRSIGSFYVNAGYGLHALASTMGDDEIRRARAQASASPSLPWSPGEV